MENFVYSQFAAVAENMISLWENLSFSAAILGIAFVVIICVMLYMVWQINERHLEIQNDLRHAIFETRLQEDLYQIYTDYMKGLAVIQSHDIRRMTSLQEGKGFVQALRVAYAGISAAYARSRLLLGESADEMKLRAQLHANKNRYYEILLAVDEYVKSGQLGERLTNAWAVCARDFQIEKGDVDHLFKNRSALECFYRELDTQAVENLDRQMNEYQTKLINEDFAHFFEVCLSSKLCDC